MKRVAVVLLLLGGAGVMAQSAPSPYVGTWRYDAAASTKGEWKTATMTIVKDTEDAISFRLSGTDRDGKPFHESFSAQKGVEAPLKGGDPGETMKWDKDGSVVVVSPQDGSKGELKVSLSEDKQTMTAAGQDTDKSGKKTDVRDVWKRVGASKKRAS